MSARVRPTHNKSVMKKILFCFVVILVSSNVLSQEPVPTKLSDANLKGNVLSVVYGKYQFKENFGEPTTGKVEQVKATYYNEKGWSVLIRDIQISTSYLLANSYLVTYEKDGEFQKVKVVGIGATNNPSDLNNYLPTFGSNESSFEQLMKSIPKQFSGCQPTNWSEFVLDKFGVIIQYDLHRNKWSNGKLIEKLVAKPVENGSYNFVIYKESGDAVSKTKRTFYQGLLTKVEDANKGRLTNYRPKFATPEAGIYKYDPKNNLVSFVTQSANERNKEETKYYYNDKGDIVKVTKTMYFNKLERPVSFYENYKYDDQGNWIYRTYGTNVGEPLFIEKRVITYCSSVDELKEKALQLQANAGQTINNEQ